MCLSKRSDHPETALLPDSRIARRWKMLISGWTPDKTVICSCRGFSLVEISIVLIIIGMILSMGIGMMKSLTRTSAVKKVRNNIAAAENSLSAFALSRGRLPCPDTDGDGLENCPVSQCSSPPCALPYMDLNVDRLDAWAQPFNYDVTDILTATNQQNFCIVLYEIINFYSWTGTPANAPCGGYSMICATDTSDADNGAIAAPSSGYYLAACVISSGEDTALGGKNRRDAGREYELSANPCDVTAGRDDIVGELTLNRLFSDTCTPDSTKIAVAGNDTDGDGVISCYSVDNGACMQLVSGQTLMVSQGQNIVFFPDSETDCNITSPHLSVDFFNGIHSAGCGQGYDMIDCDTSDHLWNGMVSIDGNTDGAQPVMTDI